MPKISVIIPIFNAQNYLAQCLESVLNQSLREIEILCVNDGSKDNSRRILEDFAKHDSRIILINNATNKGVSNARNLAINRASGEFICFMDSDDFYPNNATLATLYENAKAHNALICGGSFSHVVGGGQIEMNFNEMLFGYTFKENGFVEYENYQFDFGFHRFIYKTSFLHENRLIFPPFARYQDPPFFVSAMIKARRFYAIKNVVYCYRVREKTLSPFQIHEQQKGMNAVLKLAKAHKLRKLRDLTLSRINPSHDTRAFRIRLFRRNYNVVRLFGITLYESRKNEI